MTDFGKLDQDTKNNFLSSMGVKGPRAKKGKIEKVLHEFKEGKLHSGSKKGPEVKKRSQAVAIALNEAHRAKTEYGSHIPGDINSWRAGKKAKELIKNMKNK